MEPKSIPLPSRDQVPPELLVIHQWVCWRAIFDENKNKWRKPPVSPKTGEGIGAVEKYQDHFSPFDKALEGAKKFGLDGVGFVFTDGDPYLGIDFDRAVENGVIHSAVQTWLKWFVPGSYVEFSPSGTGLHIICKANLTKALVATKLPGDDATCEVYSTARFFTWTSQQVGECKEIIDHQVSVDKLLAFLGSDKTEPLDAVAQAEAQRPLSRLSARKIHEENLEALRAAPMGAGNATLNTCAFFAGRAFAAGALEGTEESLKRGMLEIVTREWGHPHEETSARETIRSGWNSGVAQPLVLKREDFPEVAETIEELNQKYFLIKSFGGKARVGHLELNRINKGVSYVLATQPVGDFKVGYMNKLIMSGLKANGEPKFEDQATVWLRSPYRRECQKVVFEPNKKTSAGVMNLWTGFAYEPKKGSCERYLTHVRENICQGDPIKYNYLIGWLAYAIRNPAEQGHVAIVIQGLKGVGKNVFAEGFASLWGQHGMVVSDQSRLTKNFNAHLRDKCVLICDEAFFAGDRRHEGMLKSLITGSTITIEAKGVDADTAPNLLHLIIIGNDTWLVPASYEERRFLVLACGNKKQQDQGYFQAIHDELNAGGYQGLLHHLLHEVDLRNFNVREAPHTAELRAQMSESLRGVEAAWFECLHTGVVPGKLSPEGTVELRPDTLIEWARKKERGWSNIKPPHVEALFGFQHRGMKFTRVKPLLQSEENRYFAIPTLPEARKIWDERRYPCPWPADGQRWLAPADQDLPKF